MTQRGSFSAKPLAAGLLLTLAGIAAAASTDAPWLPYDPCAWEATALLPQQDAPWQKADLKKAILERAAAEKSRREMHVYYYRIGHTLAFPLPVAKRPLREELPPGIATITYPWCIWLSWNLEERWRVLHFAWRDFGDRAAGVQDHQAVT